jgi:hypothetical protein
MNGESCMSLDQTQITGVCVDGACICHDGWTLADCSAVVNSAVVNRVAAVNSVAVNSVVVNSVATIANCKGPCYQGTEDSCINNVCCQDESNDVCYPESNGVCATGTTSCKEVTTKPTPAPAPAVALQLQ